jgi:hypothetical protein
MKWLHKKNCPFVFVGSPRSSMIRVVLVRLRVERHALDYFPGVEALIEALGSPEIAVRLHA